MDPLISAIVFFIASIAAMMVFFRMAKIRRQHKKSLDDLFILPACSLIFLLVAIGNIGQIDDRQDIVYPIIARQDISGSREYYYLVNGRSKGTC